MWVTITEPMEFDTERTYWGVHYPEDGRTWLFGEGVEGLYEAEEIAGRASENYIEAHVVSVKLVVL